MPEELFEGQCSQLITIMSKNIIFSIGSLMSLLVCIGCNDFTASKPIEANEITLDWRDDCPNCPDASDCCCGLEMISMGTCTILICGATNGTFGTCAAPPTCSNPTAAMTSTQVILTPASNRIPFCGDQIQGMWITNLGPDFGSFRLTCRGDETNPPWLSFSLDPNTRRSFEPDANCDLTPCP